MLRGQLNWNFVCSLLSKSNISVFCPKADPSLQAEKPRLQFCRRQVFHRKLRNQGCSFIRNLICVVASRWFPHPTLSLASEQTLKDLKDPRGINEEVRRVNLANWALRTLPKFATGVKHQFHQGFWSDQRSENPNHPSLILHKSVIISIFFKCGITHYCFLYLNFIQHFKF